MGQYLFRPQSASSKKTVAIIAEPVAIHHLPALEPIQLEEPQTEQPIFGLQEPPQTDQPIIGIQESQEPPQEPVHKPTVVTDVTEETEESKEDSTTPLIEAAAIAALPAAVTLTSPKKRNKKLKKH